MYENPRPMDVNLPLAYSHSNLVYQTNAMREQKRRAQLFMSIIFFICFLLSILSVWRCKDTHFFSHGRKKFISHFCAAKIERFFDPVTDSYRILPHFTDSYRILPVLTVSYRFLPIVTDSGVLLRSMGEEGTAKERQGSSGTREAGVTVLEPSREPVAVG